MKKEIIPKWIRFFAWIFLFMYVSPLIFLIGLTGTGTVVFEGFGLSYEGNTSLHPTAVYLTILFTLSASVAHGILWGKNWALRLGIAYGWIALATCTLAFFVVENYGAKSFPIEPIFLLPFIITLHHKKKSWEQYDTCPPDKR